MSDFLRGVIKTPLYNIVFSSRRLNHLVKEAGWGGSNKSDCSIYQLISLNLGRRLFPSEPLCQLIQSYTFISHKFLVATGLFQLAFAYSKLLIETLEKGVKSVQS